MSEREVFTCMNYKDAEKHLGKLGWFGDVLYKIIEGKGETHSELKVVSDINHHFETKDRAWQFFSPDPDPVEKWVPFTGEDGPLIVGRAIRFRASPEDGCRLITSASKKDVFANQWKTYEELLDAWEFTDGTPCGKKVTE